MKRIKSITLGIMLAALVTGDAAAQWNVSRFSTARKQMYMTFGLDPAVVTSLGVAGVGSLMEHDFRLSAEVGVVTAKVDAGDFRTRLGVQTSLFKWRAVNLSGSATAIVRGTDNTIYRGVNFGADVSGALGVYRPRWFVAGDGGLDKAIITHVKMTDWYRKQFYADAKDGWYLDAGGTYHYGLAGGVTVRDFELMTRLGLAKTERYKQVMPPLYMSLGVGHAF